MAAEPEPAKAAAPGGGLSPLRQFRLAFGFFTVLPLARTGSMTEIARAAWLLPLVAAFLGVVEGAVAWGLLELFSPGVAAALVLTVALILTGLHHTDGLADLGDALMVHGDRQRRLEVLKDKTMGIGAAGALIIVYLTTWAALAELFSLRQGVDLIWCLVAVEAAARLSLLVAATTGHPSHAGSGSAFMEAQKGWRGAGGIVLSLGVLATVAAATGVMEAVLAGGAALAITLLLVVVCRRLFGGLNGDVLGAAVELGRMAALLGLLAGLPG